MSEPSERALIEDLRSGKPSVRVRAAERLQHTGSAAAVPALREALRSDNLLLQLAAGLALWKIARDPEAVDATLEALAGASPDAREGAVYVLGAMGREIVPILEKRLAREPTRADLRRILEEIKTRASGSR
jgi:HEAT repeat protein